LLLSGLVLLLPLLLVLLATAPLLEAPLLLVELLPLLLVLLMLLLLLCPDVRAAICMRQSLPPSFIPSLTPSQSTAMQSTPLRSSSIATKASEVSTIV
jgi:hypothetical protein